MDTSKTYSKMCEKAEEIQMGRKPPNWHDGDYMRMGDTICITEELMIASGNVKAIWLPRQDQLQEMIDLKASDYTGHLSKSLAHRQLFEFYDFCIDRIGYSMGTVIDTTSETKQFTSMEQLWLAFVMKEKYNKVWDGEEWIEPKAK